RGGYVSNVDYPVVVEVHAGVPPSASNSGTVGVGNGRNVNDVNLVVTVHITQQPRIGDKEGRLSPARRATGERCSSPGSNTSSVSIVPGIACERLRGLVESIVQFDGEEYALP